MRRVVVRSLALSVAFALLDARSLSAQKKFDLDDFLEPSTPAAAKPSAPPNTASTSPSTSSTLPSMPAAAKPSSAKPSAPKPSAPKPSAAKPSAPVTIETGPKTGAQPPAEVPETPEGARRVKREAADEARAAQAEERAAAAQRRSTDRAAANEERAAARAAATEERRTAAEARSAAAKERAAAKVKPKREKKKTKYDLLSDEWHAPASPELSAAHEKTAVPDLVFHIQKTGAIYTLKPASRSGGFDDTQLAIAKEAFNSWGPTPHARTLDLVYAATLQFNSPYVTLISGIRKDRGGSRHSHGLAADIVLPGVEDEELAAFFRAQGFVGVGTYPRSHFVHVDTRDTSYFWIDNSKPNQRGRVVQVRKDESTAADEAARARGAEGFVNPPRLAKALKVRAVKKRKAHQAKLERAASKAAATQQTANSGPMPSSVTPER